MQIRPLGSSIYLLSSQTEGGDLKRTLFREQLARLYIPLSCHAMRTVAAASLKFGSSLTKVDIKQGFGLEVCQEVRNNA